MSRPAAEARVEKRMAVKEWVIAFSKSRNESGDLLKQIVGLIKE